MLRLSTTVQNTFLVAVIIFCTGLLGSTVEYARGVQGAGIGMILIAAWLLRYDIASRRIKAGGQARFIALSLLSGYLWLAIGGLLALLYAGFMAGPKYDALLHSLFLGFVLTMIFAHAPIIFPAILKISIVYTPRYYSHLLLLHVTLILRVVGDLLPWWPGRMWGGLLNVVVVMLFLVNTVTSAKRGAD